MLSLLLSWPGVLHFCSPHDNAGFKAIVDVLYLNQLEVRVRNLAIILIFKLRSINQFLRVISRKLYWI